MTEERYKIPEQAGRVPGLGTRRVALGLFWPTVPTGVPSWPRSPHSWLPTMLLQCSTRGQLYL